MDSGTYQLAVYYIDWLTEGVESACLVPCIKIPSAILLQGGSFSDISGVDSPASCFSPQAMVSKRLYDFIIRQSHKPIQMNDDVEEEVDKCTYKDSEECSSSSIQYSVSNSLFVHLNQSAEYEKFNLNINLISFCCCRMQGLVEIHMKTEEGCRR